MIQIDSVSLILQGFRFKNEWFKYERDSWGFKLEDSLNDSNWFWFKIFDSSTTL